MGTNYSGRTILGLITTLDISGSRGGLVRQQNMLDAFFGPEDEIPPGRQFVHAEHGNLPQMTLVTPARGVPALSPHAEANVVYIEFTDHKIITNPLVKFANGHGRLRKKSYPANVFKNRKRPLISPDVFFSTKNRRVRRGRSQLWKEIAES